MNNVQQKFLGPFNEGQVLAFLRTLRQRRNLSQNDLQRTGAIHQEVVSGMETGHRRLTLANLQNYANAMGFNLRLVIEEKKR